MAALTIEPASEMARPRTLSEAIYFSPMEDGWHDRLRAALIHEYQYGPTYLPDPEPEPTPKPLREPYHKPPELLSMHPRAIEMREYVARRKANGGQPLRGTPLAHVPPARPTAERAKTPFRAHGTLKSAVKRAAAVTKPAVRLPNCEKCGREFGADRQRHWANENRCNGCSERDYS